MPIDTLRQGTGESKIAAQFAFALTLACSALFWLSRSYAAEKASLRPQYDAGQELIYKLEEQTTLGTEQQGLRQTLTCDVRVKSDSFGGLSLEHKFNETLSQTAKFCRIPCQNTMARLPSFSGRRHEPVMLRDTAGRGSLGTAC